MSDDEKSVKLGDKKFSRRQVLAALGASGVTAMGVDAATNEGGEQAIGGGTGLDQLSANYTVDPFVGPSNFPPQDPQAGDLWIQTDSGKRLVYDGSDWGNLPLSTDEAHTETATTENQFSGAGQLNGEASFGRLPTQWNDEGIIYTDSNISKFVRGRIVELDRYVSNPPAKYGFYYSPYQETTGAKLAVSDSIESGWSFHSNLFDNSLDGDLNQEISSVWPLWDPDAGEMQLYFHSRTGGYQFTGRASSSDGITGWSYDGRILDIPSSGAWDNGERAYLNVYRYGRGYMGFYQGRDSGANHAAIGYAWSYSGEPGTWRTLEKPLFQGRHANFSATTEGIEKATMIDIGGQPHLLAVDGQNEDVLIGAWFGHEHTTYEGLATTNLPATPKYGYAPFYGPDKLYLVGADTTNINKARLWSKPWGDLL